MLWCWSGQWFSFGDGCCWWTNWLHRFHYYLFIHYYSALTILNLVFSMLIKNQFVMMNPDLIIQAGVNFFHLGHSIHYLNLFVFIQRFCRGNFHLICRFCRLQLWTCFYIASWLCRLACLRLGSRQIRAFPCFGLFVVRAFKSYFWIRQRR